MIVTLKKNLNGSDCSSIVEWINKTQEVHLICENEPPITADIIKQWFDESRIAAIAEEEDDIIGFATLTNKEAHLPTNSYEICHCIVKPKFRRMYYSSYIVLKLMEYAKAKKLSALFGRVNITNKKGFSLMNSLRWDILVSDFYNLHNDFFWFRKGLENKLIK